MCMRPPNSVEHAKLGVRGHKGQEEKKSGTKLLLSFLIIVH